MGNERRELQVDMQDIIKQKKKIYDELEVINGDIMNLENKKAKLLKKIHPQYNKVELIKRGVA